jgi:hypothetical protein
MIVDYLEHGLLPTLTHHTYEYFMSLLTNVRQLYYDNHNMWELGPAQAMLDFHAKGLAKCRLYSSDYRTFVLKAYIYLRNAAKDKFQDASMTLSLWKRVYTMENSAKPLVPSGKSPSGGDQVPRSRHCKNRDVHLLLGLLPSKTFCPFAKLSGPKIKLAVNKPYIPSPVIPKAIE